MAIYAETQTARSVSVLGRIEEMFVRIRQDLSTRREVRRTYQELSKLSDRELDDLGICRADISRIAGESVQDH